jgi:hypothetical protein
MYFCKDLICFQLIRHSHQLQLRFCCAILQNWVKEVAIELQRFGVEVRLRSLRQRIGDASN